VTYRVLIAVLLALVIGFLVGVEVTKSRVPEPPVIPDAFQPFTIPPLPEPSPTPIVGLYEYGYPISEAIPIPLPGPGASPWPTHPPKPKLAGGPYKPWRVFNANVQAARDWLFVRLSRTSFRCFDVLADRESGWRVHAENRRSGAYGIPQALPGKKMAKFGDDWQDNATTQVRWGLFYIRERYGNPCIALDHSYRTGWY